MVASQLNYWVKAAVYWRKACEGRVIEAPTSVDPQRSMQKAEDAAERYKEALNEIRMAVWGEWMGVYRA